MSNILKNKVALVTGVNGGLAEAIASELAAQGCNLLITSRKASPLAGVARALKKSGVRVESVAADLSKNSGVEKLIKAARATFPRVDILINCAGLFPVAPVEKTSVAEFDRCFAVNVRAPFLLCRAFLPAMKKRKWGRVVNIGSSSAFAGFKNTSVYCASKHALLGLTRSLFDEVRAENVRVMSLNPGSIRTEMGKKVPGQDFSTFLDPVEVARYLAFMLEFDKELVSEEVRVNRLIIR